MEYLPTTKAKLLYYELLNKFTALTGGIADLGEDVSQPCMDDVVESYGVNWLQNLLDYQSYSRDGYFKNTNSAGLLFECYPLVGVGSNTVDTIVSLFQDILPVGSNFQCLLVADHRVDDFLRNWQRGVIANKDVFHKLAKYRVEHYLNNVISNNTRNFRVFLSYSQKGTIDGNGVDDLLRLKKQIISQLETAGIFTQSLDGSALLNLLYNILYPDSDLEPMQCSYNPLDSIKRQLAHPGCKLVVTDDYLKFHSDKEEWGIKSFSLKNMPRAWEQHLMSNLLGSHISDLNQIPCPFIIHYGVHILSEKTKHQKMAKADLIAKQVQTDAVKKVPDLREQHEEWEFVRERLSKGDRFLETSYSVILSSPNENNQLIEAEQKLLSLYKGNGFRLKQDKYIHLPALLSVLPMSWGAGWHKKMAGFSRMTTALSYQPANLLPFQGGYLGTSSHGIIFFDRRGQVFNWNPFDNNTNYNADVVGVPGSGKSLLLQCILEAILRCGGRVYVFDTGRSFENMAKEYNGTFVSFEGGAGKCINPFSRIKEYDGSTSEEEYNDYLDDMFGYLRDVVAKMAAPKRGLDDLQTPKIERAIREAWRIHKQKTNISILANHLKQMGDPVSNDLSEMLYSYTKEGSYGRFFEGECNVDLTNDVTVVEFEELKSRLDLQYVIQQIMIINITSEMFGGDRKTPFCIMIDEAWQPLSDRQMSNFIESLARKARKYRGSLVLATHSVTDFFQNSHAQASFDQAAWKLMLQQEPESIDALKMSKQFSLDQGTENLLKSVTTKKGEYSEICIRGKDVTTVGRLRLDPFTLLLYSTAPEDYVAKQEKLKQGLSIGEACEAILRERGQL